MSYIFRLHKTGNTNLKGWESSKKMDTTDIQSIPDTIQQGDTSKIGSSIPSPFARLYLFEAAFQMVSNTSIEGFSMYHQLVSDCLDLFQFLYLQADTGHVTFQKWSKKERIDNLKTSNFEAHRNLGQTLDLFFNGKKFKDTREIYLIYYKNKLVGGTSPLTVLYTSPNWQQIVEENGWEFKTSAGDILFDNDPWPIHQRDDKFKLFMYKFIYAYSNQLSTQSIAFFNYFANARKTFKPLEEFLETKKLSVDFSETDLLQEFDKISVNISDDTTFENLISGKCFILKPKAGGNPVPNSDFLMSPSVEYYKTRKNEHGEVLTNQIPLVLIQGNHNLKYVDNTWDDSLVVNDFPDNPLHKRRLPGLSIKYPYITTGDFLEETLIEMPYNLDKSHFFTGFEGNFKYLLPIKKAYFNFFTLDDLKRNLQITQSSTHVMLTLNIPVRNNRSISFRKTYELNNEEHVIRNRGLRGFNLGIFPFYKIVDKESLNLYSVSLVSNVEDLSMNFFQFQDIMFNNSVRAERVVRTEGGGASLNSTYYNIQGKTFDCIEIQLGKVVKTKGMIIPIFTKEVHVESAKKDYNFAIDFGTSNTHIAYGSGKDIKSFDISEADRQMVLLSERKTDEKTLQAGIVKGADAYSISIDFFDSEFIPSYLGENSFFGFPTRTTILQHANYVEGQSALFGNMNIGFNMEFDPQAVSYNQYFTNLKWVLGDERKGAAKERVEKYFYEILLLIKNKILLNEASLKTTIVWMIPFSMSSRMEGLFEDIWESQIIEVFGSENDVTLLRKYESIVPYYAPQADFRRGADVINIDIGGGTSDVLFFGKASKQYYSTSFKFAGNDIWGEGLSEDIYLDNGFFTMLDEKIESKELTLNDQHNLLPVYEAFKSSKTLNSADICSLLFKHDDTFKFSEEIKNHPSLPVILVIHLSAIIYHICDIIKAKEMDMPERISFTGKGSSYINLIGGQKTVNRFINMLFEIFMDKEDVSIEKVFIADNPKELTAIGAISPRAFNNRDKIDEQVKNLVHLGFQSTEEFDALKDYEVQDIDSLEGLVKQNYLSFLEKMGDKKIRRFLSRELEMEVDMMEVLKFLEDEADKSFREMKYTLEGYKDDDEIDDALFFWYLKDAIYKLSKKLN